MIHILLIILKIIGIILLVLLGLALLAVLVVFFVPVRYQVQISRREGEGEPPVSVRAKVTWLLHLLHGRICYPAEQPVRICLAFYPLFTVPPKEKKSRSLSRRKKRGSAAQDASDTGTEDGIREEAAEAAGNKTPEETAEANEKIAQEETAEAAGKLAQEEAAGISGNMAQVETAGISENMTQVETADITEDVLQDQAAETKLRKLWRKLQSFLHRGKDALTNIQYTITKLCDKIRNIMDNIQYYRAILEGDAFQNAIRLCRGELSELLCRLRPKRVRGSWVIGMEDPCLTAEILSAYGVLYPLVGQNIQVIGDFENRRLEGELFLKGKIRIFTFLKVFVRIYFNKNIKELMRQWKKEAA